MKNKISNEYVNLVEKQLLLLQQQIKYNTKFYTLKLLISDFDKGDIYIPDNKLSYGWNTDNTSTFIESILLGIPTQSILFSYDKNNQFEVINNIQNIKTLYAFIKGKSRLSNLPNLELFNGFSFYDLSNNIQRELYNYRFKIIILDKNTPRIFFNHI